MAPIVIVVATFIGMFLGMLGGLAFWERSQTLAVGAAAAGAVAGAIVGWLVALVAKARAKRRPRRAAVVRAELVDPPRQFPDRLTAFVERDGQPATTQEPHFLSKMPFETVVKSYVRTPPKSLVWIRLVLLRIQRLARG